MQQKPPTKTVEKVAAKTTQETAKTDDITTVKRGDNNGADGAGVKIRGEVDETKVGEVKVTSAEGNKIGGDGVQTSGSVPETKFKALNDGIKEKFLDAASEIRKVDEALDGKFLENANKKRKLIPSRFRKDFNFAYANVEISGLEKTEFFSHSKIQTLDKKNKIEEDVAKRLQDISLKPQVEEFKTLNVDGDGIIDAEGAWNRNVDTEFKILEEINIRLNGNADAVGKITLYTDLYPCLSCQYVITQFKEKYPKVDISIIYKENPKIH